MLPFTKQNITTITSAMYLEIYYSNYIGIIKIFVIRDIRSNQIKKIMNNVANIVLNILSKYRIL
jgi:hypothetical protein